MSCSDGNEELPRLEQMPSQWRADYIESTNRFKKMMAITNDMEVKVIIGNKKVNCYSSWMWDGWSMTSSVCAEGFPVCGRLEEEDSILEPYCVIINKESGGVYRIKSSVAVPKCRDKDRVVKCFSSDS